MKAFVSGATGFAGSHLVEHLLSCGDQVLGASRSGLWGGDAPASVRDKVRLLAWDVSQPLPPETAARLHDFQPDAIYHLAAVSVPAQCGSEQPTAAAWAANVGGTQHMLDLTHALATPPRLLMVSSCYVYARVDPGQPRVSECFPLGPARAYGKTKLAAEQLVRDAVSRGEVRAVIARAFQHTGPRQSPRMIVPDWARQFASQDDPIRVVSLDTFLDLSDVRDVVRAYRRLLLDGQPGEVYNVGSGCCRRSGDLFQAMRQLCDPNRNVVELAPGRRQHPVADLARIRAATDWSPTVDLSTTLADTLQYWKQKTESS